MALEHWYARKCQEFFGGRGDDGKPLPESHLHAPRLQRQARTAEDQFSGGRGLLKREGHECNEAVVVHSLKLVYVEVRKAASGSIRKILGKFGASMHSWCSQGERKRRLTPGKRCGTLSLPEHVIDNYFFFSFVRDPIERFYSSLYQAIRRKRPGAVTPQLVSNILKAYDNRSVLWDHHLESQAMSLSSPIHWEKRTGHRVQVPLDFLGRTEHFHRDFRLLSQRLQAHTNSSRLLKFMVSKSSEVRDKGGSDLTKMKLQHLRNGALDSAVARTYEQDIACFG